MVSRALKNRTVEPITMDEWQAEIAKHRVVTDPSAKTLNELCNEMARGVKWMKRYLQAEIEAGRVKQVWKFVNGRQPAPAYKRVKV